MNMHGNQRNGLGGRNNGAVASGVISPQPPVSCLTGESCAQASAESASQVDAASVVATSDGKRRGKNFHQRAAEELSAVKAASNQHEAWQVPEGTISQVLTYVACGYSLRQAAAAVGRSHATFVKLKQRDPQFAARLLQHRELARDKPLQALLKASEHSWRAAAWLLKYLDGQERTPRARRAESAGTRKRQAATKGGRIGNPSYEAMSQLGHRGTSDVPTASAEGEAADEK